MGVSSGRSRVGDLSFRVFSRALHPEWFAVREHRRYAQSGWQADARIVEGGHVVLWSCGPTRLAEVLCGPETVLPEPGLMFQAPVRQERTARLRPGRDTEYQACFSVERLEPEVFLRISHELTADSKRGGLLHHYATASRLAPPAVSRIVVETRGWGLSVQTFHTFPEERAIVRTQSLFEVRTA